MNTAEFVFFASIKYSLHLQTVLAQLPALSLLLKVPKMSYLQ